MNTLLDCINHLKQIPQNPEYHPEGDTYVHVTIVFNRICDLQIANDKKDLLKKVAIFHDLGKIDTFAINPKTGQPTAYGHEFKSLNYVDDFLPGDNTDVKLLVKNHMRAHLINVMKPNKVKKLMDELGVDLFSMLMTFEKCDSMKSLSVEDIEQLKNDENMISFVKTIQGIGY